MALVLGGGKTGGGSQPHTQEQFFGPNTSIANNGFAQMSWGTSSGPDSLLNVTAPTLPTIITSGTYAFTLNLRSVESTVGGFLVGQLELDTAGADVFVGLQSVSANAGIGFVSVQLVAVWYLAAGMDVKAVISSHDGASTQDFSLGCYVQRLA